MTHDKIGTEFLKAIPKTDLHIHLDGSLRLSTLIDLAREQKIELPSYTEDGLKDLVFKDHYETLPEYLRGFQYTSAVMQTGEALERVAYELAEDSFADGVRYIELRFAPQLHINPSLSMEEVLQSVNRGLSKAAGEINRSPNIKNGSEPPFAYGIIGCALRMFNKGFSHYYKNLIEAHQFRDNEEIFALASSELARALVQIRNEQGIPIVGFDLAGAEAGFPAEAHKEAYQHVHKNFMKKTVHAGEAYGASSIFQAITDLYADRIGHGTYLFDERKIGFGTKEERMKYISELAQYIADRRITIEICLTSNSQTNPELRDLQKHPCKTMLDNNLSVTFCTDNTLISNTSATNEFRLAVENFSLDRKQLKDIVVYGFKRSFYHGNYKEKRAYVRKVIDYYESLEGYLLAHSNAMPDKTSRPCSRIG